MKKSTGERKRIPPEDALERYDWSRAKRGRYAKRFPRDAHAVVIAPELWEHFGDAGAVNEGLRLLVQMVGLARSVPAGRLVARTRRRRHAA